MCIQPRSGSEVPELTVKVARASNPHGTTAMAIRDHLDGLWRDEDFVEWYPRDGKPGLSPAEAALIAADSNHKPNRDATVSCCSSRPPRAGTASRCRLFCCTR